MSRFLSLLCLEVTLFVRQPFTWAVLVALVAAMLWGGHSAGHYRDRQVQVLADIVQQEQEADREARTKADHYAQPMALDLPWWKDPTDAYAYITHYLKRYAVKPPSPLSGLAVGQSDLLPYYVVMNLMVTAPEEISYDFESPRKLSLGSFDLAFVLVYLLPLGLIALSAFRLSSEQDNGILRLIAAQPVRLVTAASAKFGAVALVSVAAMLVAGLLALLVGGLPPLSGEWLGALALIGLSIAAYVLFWVAMAALVVSFWRGAIASTALLISIWIVFTSLVPALASVILQATFPVPSRLAFTDKTRQIVDAVSGDSDQIIAAYPSRYPQYAKSAPDFLKSREVAKIAVQQAVEDRLKPHSAPFDSYQREALAMGSSLRLLSPSLVLDQAFQSAAGTDAARQAAFLRDSRSYRDSLRHILWPKALEQAANPQLKSCIGCPARMAFKDFDAIPPFHAHLDTASVVHAVAIGAAYLWFVALSIMGLALARFRHWPQHL